jgi:hypothetical protein
MAVETKCLIRTKPANQVKPGRGTCVFQQRVLPGVNRVITEWSQMIWKSMERPLHRGRATNVVKHQVLCSDDHLAHVVVEDLGPPARIDKNALMAANQALQTHGTGELNAEGREAGHHDKEEHVNRAVVGQMIGVGLGLPWACSSDESRSEGSNARAAHTESRQRRTVRSGAHQIRSADLLS